MACLQDTARVLRDAALVGADRRVRPLSNAAPLPSDQGGHGGPPLRWFGRQALEGEAE